MKRKVNETNCLLGFWLLSRMKGIRKLDATSSNDCNFGCSASSRPTGFLNTYLPIIKMKNDARAPAIVVHNNPHQIPNIAPAASAKIDSGNIIEVHRMKSEINSTGPQ